MIELKKQIKTNEELLKQLEPILNKDEEAVEKTKSEIQTLKEIGRAHV